MGKQLKYPAVMDQEMAFEKWAVAADHALLAAIWAVSDHASADILRHIDAARDLLADGRGER